MCRLVVGGWDETVPVGGWVMGELQEAAERCPTCRSDVRWKRGWMVFDTPCWDPWHSAPLVEGEQG